MLCFAVFDLFYLMPIVSVKLQLLKSGTTEGLLDLSH